VLMRSCTTASISNFEAGASVPSPPARGLALAGIHAQVLAPPRSVRTVGAARSLKCQFVTTRWGMCRARPCKGRTRGMTLIEIMVVIAILGLLAAAAAVSVMGVFGDAQRKTVAMDFKTLESELELYVVKKGSLPSQSDGLKVLVQAGISRETPKDPW